MLYHKINSVFKRTEKGELIFGDWTDPVFEYLANNPWRITEKIDGTNIRVMIDPSGHGELIEFGGRTDNAQLPAKLVKWLEGKFLDSAMIEIVREKFPTGAILYGEGFGAGIQKGGGNYQDHQSFILFDVRVGDWWLQPEDVLDVAQTLNLDMVPELGTATLWKAINLVRQGMKSRFGSFEAEGVVATPVVPLFNRKGERIITKIKTRDFERAILPGDPRWKSPEECEKETETCL